MGFRIREVRETKEAEEIKNKEKIRLKQTPEVLNADAKKKLDGFRDIFRERFVPIDAVIPHEEVTSTVISHEEAISTVIPREEVVSTMIPQEEVTSTVVPQEEIKTEIEISKYDKLNELLTKIYTSKQWNKQDVVDAINELNALGSQGFDNVEDQQTFVGFHKQIVEIKKQYMEVRKKALKIRESYMNQIKDQESMTDERGKKR